MLLLTLLFACADKGSPDDSGATDSGDTDTASVAPTFTTEARWSSSDDWEPSVATAGDEVYQITTRIGEATRPTPEYRRLVSGYGPHQGFAAVVTAGVDSDWETF